MKTPIIDLHTIIQGEGMLAGVPHILIRTSGCNLRCIFGDSACDTPYSSFKPEKGKYTYEEVEALVEENPQVRNILLSGGEPFLYLDFIKTVLKDFGHHHITVETNGTIYPPIEIVEGIDLVSISPKLISSVPTEEKSKRVNLRYSEQRELDHREWTSDLSPIINWIVFSNDYQLKYVINDENDIKEVLIQLSFFKQQAQAFVPNRKVYLMPAGTTNEQLQEKRSWLMERCIELGFTYTDRLQIVAYGDKRGV